MNNNSLAIYEDGKFDSMKAVATVMAQSGLFKDAQDASKVMVKLIAGHGMGLAPFEAMAGLHIVDGKVTLSANLMAGLVKRSGRYSYRVIELTAERCAIQFYENGEKCGVSEFTMTQARNIRTKEYGKDIALADKGVWKAYPQNMLFARAMSNGYRWYCPDALGVGMTAYTPEELGAEVNADGDIIEGEIVKPTPTRKATRPWSDTIAPEGEGDPLPTVTTATPLKMPTAGKLKAFHALGVKAHGADWDDERHDMIKEITDGRASSSKEVTDGELDEMMKELEATIADNALYAFNDLGRRVYGDADWHGSKRAELVRKVTTGATNNPAELTEKEMATLMSGMNKKLANMTAVTEMAGELGGEVHDKYKEGYTPANDNDLDGVHNSFN